MFWFLEVLTFISKLDIKEEIEDEEKTIEDYIDKKMNDTDFASIETMYFVASQCLHEKKNKRPDIKKVLIFYAYLKSEGGEVCHYFPKCTFQTNYLIWFFCFFFCLFLWKVQQMLQEMTASWNYSRKDSWLFIYSYLNHFSNSFFFFFVNILFYL